MYKYKPLRLIICENMIQALRIIDIANKNTTTKNRVTRSRVQYHCRKMNYQHVVLPIEKLYQEQTNAVTMYLPGYKIMKNGKQVNPVKLVPLPKEKVKGDNIKEIIYAMYWNVMRFYVLPKGCELLNAADPTTTLPELKAFAKKKF